MDFENIKWNKKNYNLFIKYLKSVSDKKYKEFHSGIIGSSDVKMLGIRTPILKKISKEISKGDYLSFIKYNTHKYYDECVIHGLVLGYIKVSEDILFDLLDDFILCIDNWATCDVTCANLKAFKKIDIKNIEKYLDSSNPWSIRLGLVLLLDYYINDDNLNYIFDVCDSIKMDHYYVKMAVSWLISICYIKYPKETLKYLKKNDLDKFTHNKAISKICDSYRVSKDTKESLKLLKI